MSGTASKDAPSPFTHTAYFFIRTGMRKGIVHGYWKDGGRFRPKGVGSFFSKIDMLPRGGWDGRIEFVKFGDPPPENEPRAPQRPGDDGDKGDEGGEIGSDGT